LKPRGDDDRAEDVLERARTYALLFAFIFLIVGFLMATVSPCISFQALQVCAPIYQAPGDVLLAFGSAFLVLWVVLAALEDWRLDMRPR
jgi:hypothetical protein